MRERVVVFIDGPDIFYAIKNMNKKSVNKKLTIEYRKLVDLLVGNRYLVKAYFYTDSKKENLLEGLKSRGIEVKEANSKERLYTMLFTDILDMTYGNKYDTCILIGGADNLADAVKEIRQKKKLIEYADFLETASYQLRKICDKFILLDEYRDKFIKETVTKDTSFWKKILNSIANFWKRI